MAENLEIFDFISQGNLESVKGWLSAGNDALIYHPHGYTILHGACGSPNHDILELILRHNNVLLDVPDVEGNTPLHWAARDSQLHAIKVLLSFGADPQSTNAQMKKAMDLSTVPEIKTLLQESAAISPTRLAQSRAQIIQQIEQELPDDVPNLKQFTIELLLANQLFQDRCKETLRQLIEEKHVAVHKYRLLENAAGIKDNQQSNNFINQLQYLQSENEEQAATIAYQRIQNRMLESSIAQQEEYYRKNLNEMTEAHQRELKILSDRIQEAELRFLESGRHLTEELSTIRKENLDLKAKLSNGANGKPAGGDIQLLLDLQNENQMVQHRLKEMNTERIALIERLMSMEQLKNLHEQELSKVRNDMNLLRKVMQEAMTKVLTEARNEADERDESSGNIVFVRGENGSKQIKGATAEKLVERLTDPGTFDSQFLSAFMLTFRSFIDTHAFLNLLIKRYKDNLMEANPSMANIQSPTQSPIQLRVSNTIKFWIENYWSDFERDNTLLERLLEFVEVMRVHTEKLANVIRIPLNRKMNNTDPKDKEREERMKNAAPPPKALIPKVIAKRTSNAQADFERSSSGGLSAKSENKPSNWGGFYFSKLRITEERLEDFKLKLTDIEPLELARQLTLIEYELFTAIQTTEFMDQAWMKDNKEIKAPNICNMTKWSNHITRWVISEIVTIKDNIKYRAAIFERFIMIAQHLEKLNNFNGVKEILAGLQSSAVYRLKKTKEAVSSKHLKIFEDLLKLTSSDLNFKNLRSKIHASDPPLIPFPGVYQGDLVFLDTCSRSKLENGLINFLKFQKIASYVLELQVYQQTPYNLESVPEIGGYMKDFEVLSDDEAYRDSLVCEPRVS